VIYAEQLMNLRKFMSVCLFISAIVVTVTGVTLYFGIGGHNLSVIPHIYFSITFIIALVLHIFFNFKTFLSYIKNKRENAGFTKEFWVNIAVALVFVAISAYFFNKSNIKSDFPYPSIDRVPLSLVLPLERVDGDEALAALAAAGYKVPEKENLTLGDLARANNVNPRVIYIVMTSGMKRETAD
jgi:hypothetical protein